MQLLYCVLYEATILYTFLRFKSSLLLVTFICHVARREMKAHASWWLSRLENCSLTTCIPQMDSTGQAIFLPLFLQALLAVLMQKFCCISHWGKTFWKNAWETLIDEKSYSGLLCWRKWNEKVILNDNLFYKQGSFPTPISPRTLDNFFIWICCGALFITDFRTNSYL